MTAISADLAAYLAAPDFLRLRHALAAIVDKIGLRAALEFARRSEDVDTKLVAVFRVNTIRAAASAKRLVEATTERERLRVREQLDQALADLLADAPAR